MNAVDYHTFIPPTDGPLCGDCGEPQKAPAHLPEPAPRTASESWRAAYGMDCPGCGSSADDPCAETCSIKRAVPAEVPAFVERSQRAEEPPAEIPEPPRFAGPEEIAALRGAESGDDGGAVAPASAAPSAPAGLALCNHACTLCKLHGGARTVCVAGEGPADAEVMIVGQNPGEQEDDQGRPFVGKTGKLLDELLLQAGLARERVYITNAVKCITPQNREPNVREARACASYLVAEIARYRPRVIVLLGNGPVKVCVDPKGGVTKLRGKEQVFSETFRAALAGAGVPADYVPTIIPTIHPSAVLHSPKGEALKASIVDDLRQVVSHMTSGFVEIPVPWAFNDNATPETYGARVAAMPALTTEVWAFDIESNGYPTWHPAFRIAMIGIDDGRFGVAVFRGPSVRAGVEALRVALEGGATLVGHNGSMYDRVGIEVRLGVNLRCDDTMLIAHLLDEDGPKGLQDLCVRHLGVKPWKDIDFDWKRFTEGPPLSGMEWDILGEYNARDVRYTRLLYMKLRAMLAEDPPLERYYEKLFLPLSRALARVEQNGVYASMEKITAAFGEFAAQKFRAETKLRALAGDPDFNPGSPKQVKAIVFDRLGLPPVQWTDGGDESTNELSLKTLKFITLPEMSNPPAAAVPLIDALLEYRQASKMMGTYLEKYAATLATSPIPDRLFFWYSLVFTVSRSSSDGQQLPRDPRMRKILSAPPGKAFIQADFSQMELRIAAHLSQDPEMLAAYQRGDDLHRLLAQSITRRDEITDEERSRAKAANFGFLYGANEYTYESVALKEYDQVLPRAETRTIRNAFHARWDALKAWYIACWNEARETGQIRTQTGRVRRLPAIHSNDEREREGALRQAINFTDQALGLDIAGIALILAVGMGLHVVWFYHDAFYVEADGAQVEWTVAKIKEIEGLIPQVLESTFGVRFSVPLPLDVKVSKA